MTENKRFIVTIKTQVIFVVVIVASEALPLMGPMEADLDLGGFGADLGPLEDSSGEYGSAGNPDIIDSSIAMGLNGVGSMNPGLLTA
ncbi:unnamed protein product [Pieris macdunnoughi]|uniref:Uncharacterized protein n=1 Tax=Pieris macdunnoughi TaxID=345717 RepID=A0A821V5E3_9NEOP|nr:unnamed protein product [Pieris macdunnoughi]